MCGTGKSLDLKGCFVPTVHFLKVEILFPFVLKLSKPFNFMDFIYFLICSFVLNIQDTLKLTGAKAVSGMFV